MVETSTDRNPASASSSRAFSGLELLNEARYERQGAVQKRAVERGAAALGHQLVEAFERGVRNATAFSEDLDDRRLDLSEQRHHLGELGEVVRTGGTRQHGGVLARQPVGSRHGIELDDAAGRHRTEPFADVALVQS